MAKASKRSKGKSADEAEPKPNIMLMDIAVRTGLRLGRLVLEQGLLRRQLGPERAKKAMKNTGLSKTLFSIIVSRFASRSIPGAMLLGGGIVAKAILNQRKSVRAKMAEGEGDPPGPSEEN